MTFLHFYRQNGRFLAFGLLMAFFSSFGQTFYIGVFSLDIRTAFDLTHGDFGLVYSIATLASAMCLVWAGRQIDRIDLRLFTGLVCMALAMACLLMAVVPSLALLYVAIFAMRFTGQGLMSHTALTSIARYFHDNRGRALSFANLGFPAGQAVFPLIGVALIAAFGWREAWLIVAIVLATTLAPLMLWLLKGHGERHRRLLAQSASTGAAPAGTTSQWTRRDVLRDPRFYLLAPSALALSFIFTGIFFHQVHLTEAKGWSLSWFATCFIVLAATSVASLVVSGPIIDRLSAARVFPFILLPISRFADRPCAVRPSGDGTCTHGACGVEHRSLAQRQQRALGRALWRDPSGCDSRARRVPDGGCQRLGTRNDGMDDRCRRDDGDDLGWLCGLCRRGIRIGGYRAPRP